MRPWFVAGMLLPGCASEFTTGQATDGLGLEPFGGAYNPSLAGCILSEGGYVNTYDSKGRIKVALYDDDNGPPSETETRWDGPCRVKDTTEAQNGELRLWDYTCDAEGWPVSATNRVLAGVEMSEIDHAEYSWENTYVDGELVHVDYRVGDSPDVDSTDLEWADNRVVRRDTMNRYGVLDANTYVYNDDGWVVEITSNELVTTYTYDDHKRLVSSVQGESRVDWSYRDDHDKWPYLRTYSSDPSQGTALTFDCP